MAAALRVGLAGLGTVGAGVVRLLDENAALIARRAGRPIAVTAVSARDRARDRGFDPARFPWEDAPAALATRDDVDVVVEVMGGEGGAALDLARAALGGGKALVTANKAMIARHGLALAALAEARGLPLKFEAAVAGGIPVIKGLREGAAANELTLVLAILNGTCNLIVSTMEDAGVGFAEVLADAQRLGYAEADPALDVGGFDAAHKLAVLASLAFGTQPDLDGVAITGVAALLPGDFQEAGALGYRVRLIALAEPDGDRLRQRVAPSLVPASHRLASVKGATNAVLICGNFVGPLLFEGSGAGAGPTASAVVADLIDVARGEAAPAFAMPTASLRASAAAPALDREERSYVRLLCEDRPGVLAELTAAFRDAGVSIATVNQPPHVGDGPAFVALTSHRGPARRVATALAALAGRPWLTAPPLVMPIID